MTATVTPLIGGRYQIKDLLGRGGMATVHRAHDTQLRRDVALKIMRADFAGDPVFEARFVNEARNAASISHPNVVTVLDFGTEGPGPYIVMELVEGGDLSRVIAQDGPLTPERAAAIAAEVAAALQAAHTHGIVHRDVKPGNILLAADGHPRVADFGIARATGEQSLTGTGTSLGSVDYFSPEQARGEPATAASDIYALGVVLYEMLTGVRPFTGDTAYAIAVARVEAPPPDPRAVVRKIPKPLAAVVQRAMATDPVARYASAADMGRALEMWLSRKIAGENRRAAAATAAVLAADAAQSPTPAASSEPETAAPPAAKGTARRARPAAAAPAAASIAAGAAAPAAAGAVVNAASPADETRAMPAPASLAAPAPAAAERAAPAPAQAPATVQVAAPAAVADARPVAVAPVASTASVERRDGRGRRIALLAIAAVLLLAVIGFAGGSFLSQGGFGDGVGEDPTGGIIVGQPSGGVLAATPEPTDRPTPTATSDATPEPTESATPEPTPAPVAEAPASAPPAAAAPPARTTPPENVVVAMAETPDDTVERWYALVVDGQFDAAYAMWSDRMRANFPRQGNLDNRWRDTAGIEILNLYVAEQTATTAKVQIEFIEYKDNGSSRYFIGWWELVRSGDGWLLDWPHF